MKAGNIHPPKLLSRAKFSTSSSSIQNNLADIDFYSTISYEEEYLDGYSRKLLSEANDVSEIAMKITRQPQKCKIFSAN